MAAIKGKNTKPELRVRSLLHKLGCRFRLHRNDLSGRPDIVLPKYKLIIFVHGCFWHSHSCRYGAVEPATRKEFWTEKRAGTVNRDRRHQAELQKLGWRVCTIWECQTKSDDLLEAAVKSCL